MNARHRSSVAFCAAACALLVLVSARSARSEAPAIEVAASGCPETPELTRILVLDLRAQVVKDAQHATRIDIACRASAATIVVDDPITVKSSRRVVELQPDLRPVVQARLLAVAAAELVRWSWSEVTVDGRADSSPTAGPGPPAAAVRAIKTAVAATPVARTVQVAAFGHVRNFHDGLTFVGGGLGVSRMFAGRWQLAMDAVAAGRHAEVAPGSVDSTLLGVAAHLSRTMWANRLVRACLGGGARADLVNLQPHVALRTPAASLSAEGLRTWLAGPFGRVSFRAAGAATWGVMAALEVGYAFGGVRGTVPNDRDLNVRQLWQAAFVGIEVAL